jgi:hypothetical protein
MSASSPPPAGANNTIFGECPSHQVVPMLTPPLVTCQIAGALVGFGLPFAMLYGWQYCRGRNKAKKITEKESLARGQ